jgi:hypothetical protein
VLDLDAPDRGKYVESIAVGRGHVVITYGREANARIAGGTLMLHPRVTAEGGLEWDCGYTGGSGVTDIERKYLPAACRG